MNHLSNKHKSSGFSMIELLVAMGILVVLIGIVAFTVSNITSGAKARQTKVRLEALEAMFTELKATAGLKKQPGKMYLAGTPVVVHEPPTNPEPINIWFDANPQEPDPPTPNAAVNQPIAAPGNVSIDSFTAQAASGPAARIRSAAVLNTQLVMGIVLTVPKNASALAGLPPNSLMENPNANGQFSANMGSITFSQPISTDPMRKSPFKPGILVDGWNNPIIFVPAAGMSGVKFKEHGDELHIINSLGSLTEEADAGPSPGFPNYKLPPQARPFFASAGPDGDFSTGDDNIYSFEN